MFLIRFLKELNTQLGYTTDYRKYSQLIAAMLDGTVKADADQALREPIFNLCKILFLQNQREEAEFKRIFDANWAAEISTIARALAIKKQEAEAQTTDIPPAEPSEGQSIGHVDNPFRNKKVKTDKLKKDDLPEDEGEIGAEETQTVTRYFYPEFNLQQDQPASNEKEEASPEQSVKKQKWQDTDEYFPVSRRQIEKGWQFLRIKDKGPLSSAINIPETVKKIANENTIGEPVYQRKWKNREDTLLILADYRGSMSPFHNLVNRIIYAAKENGIHKASQVYFFQNYPVDYVYQDPAMFQAVRLDKIYSQLNVNSTMVLLISDAGAARGLALSKRVEGCSLFLNKLRKYVNKITWLNPMPKHRWGGTSAELLLQQNPWLVMMPLFGEDEVQFQRIIQALLAGKELGA